MQYKKIIVFFLIIIGLDSCVMTKDVFTLNPDKKLSTDNGGKDFVELTNGKIIQGDISDMKLYNFKFFVNRTGTLEISGKNFAYDEINAMQEKGQYYLKGSPKNFLLPRVKTGRLNLYRRYMQNSRYDPNAGFNHTGKMYNDDFYLYFIQKGSKDDMVKFSVETLTDMVSDYQPSLNFINEYKQHKRKINSDSYLDKAIDAYNSK